MYKTFMLCALILCACTCGTIKEGARDTLGDVVDCTIADVKSHTNQYGPLLEATIRAATSDAGAVDWTSVKDATKGLAARTGMCVLATVVARAMTPTPATPGAPQSSALQPDPASLRKGFDAIRAEQAPGVTFKTEAGTL